MLILVPLAKDTSVASIVAFTTLNVVLYSPVIFVSLTSVALIVTFPVPTALLLLVTIVVPVGRASAYATTFLLFYQRM